MTPAEIAERNPVLRTSGFKVTEKAMRPASTDRTCFYCHQPIGAEHTVECVQVVKTVRLAVTVEIEKTVPANWTESDIQFSMEESSSCANNFAADLNAYVERMEREGRCLCGDLSVELIADSNEARLEE